MPAWEEAWTHETLEKDETDSLPFSRFKLETRAFRLKRVDFRIYNLSCACYGTPRVIFYSDATRLSHLREVFLLKSRAQFNFCLSELLTVVKYNKIYNYHLYNFYKTGQWCSTRAGQCM